MKCCPACGFELETLTASPAVGDLTVTIDGDVTWRGERVHLSPAQAAIVYTLAVDAGIAVKVEGLVNILDSRAACERNVIAVQVHRARRAFEKVDPTFTRIENVRGRGYRWRTGA